MELSRSCWWLGKWGSPRHVGSWASPHLNCLGFLGCTLRMSSEPLCWVGTGWWGSSSCLGHRSPPPQCCPVLQGVGQAGALVSRAQKVLCLSALSCIQAEQCGDSPSPASHGELAVRAKLVLPAGPGRLPEAQEGGWRQPDGPCLSPSPCPRTGATAAGMWGRGLGLFWGHPWCWGWDVAPDSALGTQGA